MATQETRALSPAERLIVAADFAPGLEGDHIDIFEKVRTLAETLNSTGVTLKVNSALRSYGYNLISNIRTNYGLQVMADLKLNDIPNTMQTDAMLLNFFEPGFVTVMCSAGVEGMRRVQNALPQTEVLGVTVLTSLTPKTCNDIYGCSPEEGVLRFAEMAKEAGLRGLVCSPHEVATVKNKWPDFPLSLYTPGIRPAWAEVKKDDQARVMTIGEAIRAGSTGVIVGRPIVENSNPRTAALRCIEEIAEAM